MSRPPVLRCGRGTASRCPIRSSAGTLAVVLEGSGESKIGATTHQWQPRDIFTLPEWAWTTHKATGTPARLLMVTDREVRRRLGLLREERE